MTCPTCNGEGTVRDPNGPPPPPDHMCGIKGGCDAPFGCGPTDVHERYCPTCGGMREASDAQLEARQRRAVVRDHVESDRAKGGPWSCECPWCVSARQELVRGVLEREGMAA